MKTITNKKVNKKYAVRYECEGNGDVDMIKFRTKTDDVFTINNIYYFVTEILDAEFEDVNTEVVSSEE